MNDFVAACVAKRARLYAEAEELRDTIDRLSDLQATFADDADFCAAINEKRNAVLEEKRMIYVRTNPLDEWIGNDDVPTSTFDVTAAKLHAAKVQPAKATRPGLRAELTDADIAAIRADNRSATVVGAQYGVSRSTVSNIKTRKGCYA